MKPSETKRILAYLAAGYRTTVDDLGRQVYVDALASADADDAMVAARRIVQTRTFFPVPAELLAAIRDAKSSRQADENARALPQPVTPADVPPEVATRFDQLRRKWDARDRLLNTPPIDREREGAERPPPAFVMQPDLYGPTTGPRLEDGHAYVMHRGREIELDSWFLCDGRIVWPVATWDRLSRTERRAEGLPSYLDRATRRAGVVHAGLRPDPDQLPRTTRRDRVRP